MSLADLQNMFLNPDLLERYGPRFIDGLLVTGKLVAISFTLGALLGLLIALGRLSSNRFLRSFTGAYRSEEHTSELQSRCEISYAVFCLKK